MFILSMVWLAGGVFVGGLANLAAIAPVVWWRSERWSRWGLVGLGALAAVGGGWLGTLLFGRLFGSAMAAWVAVLSVALVPYGVARLVRRAGNA
jgi:hypothetical protein